MRYILLTMMSGIFLSITAQEVFRSKWQGIAVQDFVSASSINQFSVSGPDGAGYVYLKAHSSTGSADIIRTKWQGTAVQDFAPGSGAIVGFEASGPDFEGYVTLTAVASDASTRDIFRTKWQGTAVQAFTAPSGNAISGFTVSGPDAGGYVTLTAVTAPIGIGEKFDKGREMPLIFALNPITPNPSFGHVQISYSIAKPSKVNLQVYDTSGRLVRTVISENQEPGRYQYSWLGRDDHGRKVGVGVYFAKLDAGNFHAVKKLVKW